MLRWVRTGKHPVAGISSVRFVSIHNAPESRTRVWYSPALSSGAGYEYMIIGYLEKKIINFTMRCSSSPLPQNVSTNSGEISVAV